MRGRARGLACAALAGAMASLACGGGLVEMPEALYGTWETLEPRYEGRSLEFRSEFVVFGLGGINESTHRIDRIERGHRDREGEDRFTIWYLESGGDPSPLEIQLTQGTTPELRLGHQPFVWLPREAVRRRRAS